MEARKKDFVKKLLISKVSLSVRRFWGKKGKMGAKNLLSPSPLGRPDTQAIQIWKTNNQVEALANALKNMTEVALQLEQKKRKK